MELEIVVCSSSGKPIFHHEITADTYDTLAKEKPSGGDGSEASNAKSSFVSSLQGLLSFLQCMQNEELREMETNNCRCLFQVVENLTFAVIMRPLKRIDCGQASIPALPAACLQRLLSLLHSQILFLLSDRGLDVLRRQPGYDLRELLSGTEGVMTALSDIWATNATLRMRHLGVRFLHLAPELRMRITRALEYESPTIGGSAKSSPANDTPSSMICGLLLADEQVVAIAQPNKNQFSILVDDLLLLINFVYHAPSLAKSETWTPVCLPSFNSKGFLNAYVVFLTRGICLLLLSSQQSPAQFHYFQAKKEFIAMRLETLQAFDAIDHALQHQSDWQPHSDLPLLHHFIYKNEITGECASPELAFPFDPDDRLAKADMLNQYARIHHQLLSATAADPASESQVLGKRMASLRGDTTTPRMMFERHGSALLMGMCSDDHRLYVWLDAVLTVAEGRDLCRTLLQRLKRDDALLWLK